MFAERLKLARKKAGFSLRELAQELNGMVSAQAIGKYERDEMKPGSQVLIALSRALGEPVAFFLSPAEARLDKVDFRKAARTTARDRARVEGVVLDQVERYLLIERLLELPTAAWSAPIPLAHLHRLEDVEAIADAVRQAWKLGTDPIPDMTELLEEHGIKVLKLDLPERVSGLTCLARWPGSDAAVPVIVVNQANNLERRRLTLAHELAHRVTDEQSEVDIEAAAMRFAGAFLMPREHLLREVGRRRQTVSYRELMDLKQLYRVSASALLVRLSQIGVIDQPALQYVFRTIGRGWRREEPSPLQNKDAEAPKRFERLCYRALAEGRISLPKAAELLRVPMKQVAAEVRGPGAGHRQ